jgi:hypothetical protein
MKLYFFLLAVSSFICISCSDNQRQRNNQLDACVDSFSVYYFNYHLNDAARFATDDSRKWIELMASNVTEQDVELLKSQGQDAEVEIVSKDMEDSVATVSICVKHYLRKDTIGQVGRITDDDTYVLRAVAQNDKWKIRMEGPLRSERRNRD